MVIGLEYNPKYLCASLKALESNIGKQTSNTKKEEISPMAFSSIDLEQ